MSNLTPEQIAQKWANRLSSATADIQAGVQAVTVSPTATAAKNPQKYLDGVNKAVQSGKWASRLNAVSLTDWQTATIQKGIPRISQGAQAAQPKMASFMSQLIPFQNTLQAKVNAMPSANLQDSINRMTAWVQGMATFKPR